MTEDWLGFLPPVVAGAGRDLVVGVSVKVELRGALATVSVSRKFRNTEDRDIEGVLAFPTPALARVFRVEAHIGGRGAITARLLPREEAEKAYRKALEEGRLAALHAETLPGLHLWSLGPVAPGAEVVVTGVWAMPLQLKGDTGRLRIPMTIAAAHEVAESEEEVARPRADRAPGWAELEVSIGEGSVHLGTKALIPESGSCWSGRVPDNVPVDLTVSGWRRGELIGQAADGREVWMRIGSPVNVVVLVDDSDPDASTGGGDYGRSGWGPVWEAAMQVVVEDTTSEDTVDVRNLNEPLEPIPPEADVLLLTDGRRGIPTVLDELGERRLFVVQVSDDGFDRDSELSRRATRSGGDVYLAAGEGVAAAVGGALEGLRRPKTPGRARIEWDDRGRPTKVTAVRGGATITARWLSAPGEASSEETSEETSAVAAVAAGLVLDDLHENEAERTRAEPRDRGKELALREKVLSPWTAFVLFDEEGGCRRQCAELRRAALPRPPGEPEPGEPESGGTEPGESESEEPEPGDGGDAAGGSRRKDGLRVASAFIVGTAAYAWLLSDAVTPLLLAGVLGFALAVVAVNFAGYLAGILARVRRGFTPLMRAAAVTGALAIGGALVALNLLLPWVVAEYRAPPLAGMRLESGLSDRWEEFDDLHELEDRSLPELAALVGAPPGGDGMGEPNRFAETELLRERPRVEAASRFAETADVASFLRLMESDFAPPPWVWNPWEEDRETSLFEQEFALRIEDPVEDLRQQALAQVRMFPVAALLPGESRASPEWWLWGLSPIGLLLAGFSFRRGYRITEGRRQLGEGRRTRLLGAG